MTIRKSRQRCLWWCVLWCVLLSVSVLAWQSPTKQPRSKLGRPPAAPKPKFKLGKAAEKLPSTDNSLPSPQIIYKANKGYLALLTTPGAQVQLSRPGRSPLRGTAQQGMFKLENIEPGLYRVNLALPDYVPLQVDLRIAPGRLTSEPFFLVPKYGKVLLSLGAESGPDVRVEIDGKTPAKNQLQNNNNVLTVAQVAVGQHTLKVSKPGHRVWTDTVLIQPGQCDNVINVTLKSLTRTLALQTKPRARVALDDGRVWTVSADGKLLIKELKPGTVRVNVSLPGYLPQERIVNLPAVLDAADAKDTPVEDVLATFDLLPAIEVAALEAGLAPNAKDWWPRVPANWELASVTHLNQPKGLKVVGDTPALLSKKPVGEQLLNQFGDFDLTLDVRLLNGKGAAWIVRAQDDHNYYLFELTTPQSARGLNRLVFYVCRNGQCEEKLDRTLYHNLTDSNRSYNLKLSARQGVFKHKFTTESGIEEDLCADIPDNGELSFGGVGLRAINGLEMFVAQFTVTPLEH